MNPLSFNELYEPKRWMNWKAARYFTFLGNISKIMCKSVAPKQQEEFVYFPMNVWTGTLNSLRVLPT